MLGPLNVLDLGVIALSLISGLLAMYRGFTREILSIASWLAAAVAAFYVFKTQRAFAQQLADQFFQSTTLALAVLAAAVFLLVLIIVHFITVFIADRVLDSHIGPIDRTLGFLFGLVRGFLIVVIAFLFFDFLSPDKEQQPNWVRNAQSLPYLRSTGETLSSMLMSLVPEDFSFPGSGEGNSEGTEEGRAPSGWPRDTRTG